MMLLDPPTRKGEEPKKSSQSKFVTKTWEELVFRVEKELKNLYDEVRYAAWQK